MLSRGHQNAALILAAIAALVSVVLLGAMMIWRSSISSEIKMQVTTNCEGLEQLKGTIRAGLTDRRDLVKADVTLDAAQKGALLAYYDRRLKSYAAQQC